MSNFRIVALARATALAAVLVMPAVSAFAEEQYYANITNPVPELSGQKISRAEVKVVASTINPHPELNGQGTVAIASTTQHK
jgi:hypothetical protein